MPNPTYGSPAARELPARPNLQHLKNEAKQRLEALRGANPGTQLADAQFQLAREHGFASWRELKAEVDRRTGIDPLGDWIGDALVRVALHVRRAPGGGFEADMDSPDSGRFGFAVDELTVAGDRLTLVLTELKLNSLYDARWDAAAQAWVGEWRQNGMTIPLSLRRGVYPPAPRVEGLDGVWEGWLNLQKGYRLIFSIRTGRHGTLVKLDSPDRNTFDMPADKLHRDGRKVAIAMKTVAFEGELDAAGTAIHGVFKRAGRATLLVLTRRAPGAAPLRRPDPPLAAVPTEVLASYAGRYSMAPGFVTTITVEDGQLYSRSGDQPKLALFATSEATFFWKAVEATLSFRRAQDGTVSGVVVHAHGRDTVLPREV